MTIFGTDTNSKAKDKEPLTVKGRAAQKQKNKKEEERLRWEYYATIPKRHWNMMSGRPNQVLNQQAQRYGLPFDGATINLPAVVRALHNFLAENAPKLAREGDPLMQGSSSPALERYRDERAKIARLERLEKEQQLIPRDESRQALGRIAGIIRNCGEILQRQFGPAALDILNEALDDAALEIERSFGEIEAAGVPENSGDTTAETRPA